MPQLALLLTTVIWAATFPATKLALEQVLPFPFLFLRFLLGTLAVGIVFVCLRQPLRYDAPTLRMAAIASAFLFVGYVTQTVGLRYTTASNSAFITALYVVLVPLFLKRFDARLWTALALAVAGLWLLIRPSADMKVGDLYTLAAAVAFALHIIVVETYARRSDFASVSAWQLVMVTGVLVAPAVAEGYRPGAIEFTPVLVWALVITGVGATALAFFVQVWAQRYVPAQRVALIFALEPALAAWLSWLVLGEQLDAAGWAGSGLVTAGVLIGATAPAPLHH
ncbi:MAG: DMT family transporter, partial [Nitrospirota bacterium]